MSHEAIGQSSEHPGGKHICDGRFGRGRGEHWVTTGLQSGMDI